MSIIQIKRVVNPLTGRAEYSVDLKDGHHLLLGTEATNVMDRIYDQIELPKRRDNEEGS